MAAEDSAITVRDTKVANPSPGRPRILDLFERAKRDERPLYVSAPMVRYSKLPFRLLVRDHGVDVAYTPMILAHEFVRSQLARDSDFTTCPLERQPTADGREHVLIAQLASSDPTEFARAAELLAPYVDGVDLNCGCPQRWALKEGIGCSLMANPGLVADMVRAAKQRLGPTKSVSCKIRIHRDLSQTMLLVQTLESAGTHFLTVHGRTRSQRSNTPPDYAAIRTLKMHTGLPVIANGDAYDMADVSNIVAATAADGVMAARGVLEQPELFDGRLTTSPACVKNFLEYAVRSPVPFQLVLHHMSEMTARMEGMSKKERKRLMECADLVDLIDFVDEKWGLRKLSS